jgi:hypothetical protein
LIGPIYISCIVQKILMSTYHHFIFITPIRILLITNRKRRSLTLYSKLRRAYTWTSLRELIRDNGSSQAPKFCCPPNARETKRESREARSGYRITCPRGIRGWPAYKDRDRTRAVKRWGIPQDVDAERERTLISRMPLNSNINSLYLLLNTFSSRPFLPVLERIFIYDQISQISFFLYNAQLFEYFFFFSTNFNYLHQNLTLPVLERIFIYDQISQIYFFLYNARSFEYFFFFFTNYNYLHRNLTVIVCNNVIVQQLSHNIVNRLLFFFSQNLASLIASWQRPMVLWQFPDLTFWWLWTMLVLMSIGPTNRS